MAQNDGIIILPIPPSSITAGDLTDIASAVLDVAAANHNADGTIGRKIQEPKRGY